MLWSHYADAHKGFCVGFNTNKLVSHVKGTFEKVTYQCDFPIFKFLENHTVNFSKALATKHNQWDYEKEWRITKANSADQEIDILNDTLVELYLGAKMNSNAKGEIKEILERKTAQVRIFEMQLSKRLFKVEPILIS